MDFSVNPLLINVIPPSIKDEEKCFFMEATGEALWQWRNIRPCYPEMFFGALNKTLGKLAYEISSNASDRLGRRIKIEVNFLLKKMDGKNTKKRKEVKEIFLRVFKVEEGEMVKVPHDIVLLLREQNQQMQEEIDALNKEVDEKGKVICQLLEEGMSRRKEMERLEKATEGLKNKGKEIHEVGSRQQQRQITSFRDKSESVLWFAETYGLVPKMLIAEEKETGVSHEVHFAPENKNNNPTPPSSQDQTSEKTSSKYSRLSEDEKDNIKKLVYILDRFGVSIQAYHELTQLDENSAMARSYLLEECQADLTASVEISKTPGQSPGAEMHFPDLLEEQLITHYKNQGKEPANDDKIQVKISGDGAAISRSSNLLVCSFAILNDGNVMSSSGNHTIAIVKTKENYESLRESLQNAIKEVNSLSDRGFMMLGNTKINLEFFLGGDYKFLLLCLGMKGAISNNACIYCKVHKKERQDMSKGQDTYWDPRIRRHYHANWHKDPGCQHQTLFKIPLDHVIVDELHMMLRVTDKLEEGLIYEMLDWDEQDNFGKQKSVWTSTHLDSLKTAIRSCGVGFSVWQNKEGKYDWTSLMGGDKKRVLRNLPDKFGDILKPNRKEAVTKLWKDFGTLYDSCLSNEKPTAVAIETFGAKAQLWARHLLSMKGPGYDKNNPITPYIHVMVYHCPRFLEQYGSIKKFTGQGVEKKNDDVRRNFHRKINRWDACGSLMKIEKRQEMLIPHGREKRSYEKKNVDHWEKGGKQAAVLKFPRIC